VDGAIHKAAGPGLLEVCRLLGGCATGEAKITRGYKLPARFVIHTVGPVWSAGLRHEPELLASCYQKSLAQATLYECKIVAFPNISTGVYHFPKEMAAEIACREVQNYLLSNTLPEKVIFVCFDDENLAIYKKLLNN